MLVLIKGEELLICDTVVSDIFTTFDWFGTLCVLAIVAEGLILCDIEVAMPVLIT